MKYVVVSYSDDLIQCIGVYDNHREAYGKAYCYLADVFCDNEEATVSFLYELEMQTGYGIVGKDKHSKINVYVLFCDEGDKSNGIE